MERETTEIVNKTALNLIDRAQKLKDGSEEQKRLLDSASTLLKSLNEDYKLKEDAVDRRYQIEVNKKHSEEEIEVKKLQIKEHIQMRICCTGCLSRCGLSERRLFVAEICKSVVTRTKRLIFIRRHGALYYRALYFFLP